MTVSVVVAVADPVEFVTVTVYVVVDDGLTMRVPLAPTPPIPWSIVTWKASVVLQLRVAGSPAAIDVGATFAVTVGAGGMTVRVVDAVPDPALFVTVIV